MTYAYSSESSKMDFPNPFRVANIFLFLIASFCTLTAFTLIFLSRDIIGQKFEWKAFVPLIIGVVLLFYAFRVFVQLGRQLKFYFGRGQPDGLAPELAATQTGSSKEAGELNEILRQGALNYPVPEGALNGVLYSIAKKLIYAPEPIQNMAQAQFFNFMGALSTLICFFVGVYVLAENESAGRWVGVFFYFFTLWLLLRPMYRAGDAKSKMGSTQLLAMIVIAIMGPVFLRFISHKLPNINCFSINDQVFWLLLAALLAEGLYLIALIRQTTKNPQTTVGCEQVSLSMNDSPTQLINELNRNFQADWVERIPNRVYVRSEPEIDSANKSGAFQAALMEETQPVPPGDVEQLNFGVCATEPRLRWLLMLNLLGLLFTIGGCVVLLIFGKNFHVDKGFIKGLFGPCSPAHDLLGILSTGSALVLLGSFCAKAANTLWGRFDFESDLIWVEMQGHYDTARMDYGNLMTDRLKTERDMITIEGMTLRVWATRLQTVVFAADSNSARENKRYLIGLRALQQKSQKLVKHLQDFANAQSLLITPNSQHDIEKAQKLHQLNQTSQGHSPNVILQQEVVVDEVMDVATPKSKKILPPGAPGMPMVDPHTGELIVVPVPNHTSEHTSSGAISPKVKLRYCAECGHGNSMQAKFCVECGHKLQV
jgi:hypothetical protein